MFARDPGAAHDLLVSLSRMSKVPVFAKLTADVTDIVAVAEACVRAGAHGLSLINTLSGMVIDVETFRPKLGAVTGGLSGPAIRPIAVRCVHQVARALPDVPIMGIGGIASAEDAVEFLLAGAWAVQVGTVNYYRPSAALDVAAGIAAYLTRKGLSRPDELRGKVKLPEHAPEPAYRSG